MLVVVLISNFWLGYLGGIAILGLSAQCPEPHITALGCGRRRKQHADFPGAALKPMEMTLFSARSHINIFTSLPRPEHLPNTSVRKGQGTCSKLTNSYQALIHFATYRYRLYLKQ